MAGNWLANMRIASRNHLVQSISREESFALDRGSETVPSVACPDPDGQGAGNESQEVREIGQPPAGTLEATAASVYRTYLLQTLWDSLSGPRSFLGGLGQTEGAKKAREKATPTRTTGTSTFGNRGGGAGGGRWIHKHANRGEWPGLHCHIRNARDAFEHASKLLRDAFVTSKSSPMGMKIIDIHGSCTERREIPGYAITVRITTLHIRGLARFAYASPSPRFSWSTPARSQGTWRWGRLGRSLRSSQPIAPEVPSEDCGTPAHQMPRKKNASRTHRGSSQKISSSALNPGSGRSRTASSNTSIRCSRSTAAIRTRRSSSF